ncbi:MAG: UvrD-helicase domain-containing protein [Dechloromonas sp.]|nr:UvrD-helicase domain-containing protein [Dechloromonas sp.]
MSGLNPQQHEAIHYLDGPLLVLAGAGSGKTRVITQRIGRLIEQGHPPRSIFAVTFTNKASAEMAERLEGLVGHERASAVWISTFHALGAELVRQESKHVASGERFVVYDAADTLGVVKEILRDLQLEAKSWDAGAIMARISNAKNALTSPDEMPMEGAYDELAAKVFPRYVAAMKRLNALDFDDLILVPLRLLTQVREVRERWHAKVRHLLVDEFQDTSRAQLLFVKELVGERREVFCVGDDDQAIYGWRGADVKNIIEFPRYFPGAKVVALEQNYRSRQPILDVANASIVKATRAYPKKLFSDKKQGSKVTIVECDSYESEVKFCVDTAAEAIKKGVPLREISVLYRSNGLAKGFEEALRLAAIPYRVIGGTSFYERREVKDLTAYLRLSLYPNDDISFRRVVNYPARGIGDVSFERLERYARARSLPLFDAARQAQQVKDLDDRARNALASFVSLVGATRERLERGEGLVDVARAVATAVDLRGDITRAGPSPAVATKRINNLEEFYRTLGKVPAAPGGSAARQAINRLALRFSDDEDERGDKVVLSTLHGSKGLEFKLVFLVGCDEGVLPHSRTDNPKATDILSTIDPDEERRLFYVGVTRAKETLYLTRARVRALRGAGRQTAPSRFLLDVPQELFEKRTYTGPSVLATQDLAAQARAAREALAALRGKG